MIKNIFPGKNFDNKIFFLPNNYNFEEYYYNEYGQEHIKKMITSNSLLNRRYENIKKELVGKKKSEDEIIRIFLSKNKILNSLQLVKYIKDENLEILPIIENIFEYFCENYDLR